MRVFEIAESEEVSTADAADRVAEERITKIRQLGTQQWGRMIQRDKLHAHTGMQ
jgi:hypothetical protein